MTNERAGFGRLRTVEEPSPRAAARLAMFSEAHAPPPLGAVTLTCSRCRQRTRVTLAAAFRAALPSVHLPLRAYPSWMRCPACRRRSWMRVSIRA